MSTYTRQTKHPVSKKWEDATWIDNYFGSHNYGVSFPSENEQVFDPRDFDLPTRDNPVKKRFETKDSGNRVEFKSGMVRDINEDKPQYLLVYIPMLKRWAELMTRGAKKYGAHNWKKASGEEELERFKDSAFRHMMQYLEGDETEDHAAAVFFNISGAEYVKSKINGK